MGVDVSFRSFLCAKENGHKSHIGRGLGEGGCLCFFLRQKVRKKVSLFSRNKKISFERETEIASPTESSIFY